MSEIFLSRTINSKLYIPNVVKIGPEVFAARMLTNDAIGHLSDSDDQEQKKNMKECFCVYIQTSVLSPDHPKK